MDSNDYGLGQYRQRVNVTFDVIVHVGKGDSGPTFNDVSHDDIRAGVERFIEQQMAASRLYGEATVKADRLSTSGYFPDGVKGEQMARRPFWVTLDEVIAE